MEAETLDVVRTTTHTHTSENQASETAIGANADTHHGTETVGSPATREANAAR